jgi:hypothetical protein
MRRHLLAAVLGLGASACPSDDAPPSGGPTEAGSGETTTPGDTTKGDPSPGDAPGSTGEPAPWLEAGWGLSDFNAYDGVLPVLVGPQGLAMFSVPLRGQGFHNPPAPGFDNPEMPIVQAWVDVPRLAEGPSGHLTEVVDYPALFYPSFEEPGVLEGVAVWLVIPDAVDPAALVGEPAELHVELVDAHGLRLHDDHALVIGEDPRGPGGP